MLIPLYIAVLPLIYTPILAQTQASPSTQIPSSSRWGHACNYLPSPPTLVIHGGKTDPDSIYSYSSASNVGSTLFLALNSTFFANSAPFIEVESPPGPALVWHTISPFAHSDGTWQTLSFGGDSGISSQPSQSSNNSAWLDNFDLQNYSSLQYINQPENWGSQPSNRIYHSAVTGIDGKVYITGGLKNDGSNTAFADVYLFDSTQSRFAPLPSLQDGLYHHTSIMLGNNSILVLGGAFISQITSNIEVFPYTKLYRLDLSLNFVSHWIEFAIGGDAPQGRRGATATLSHNGDKIILLGGASSDLQTVYDEIWTLDLNTLTWEKIVADGTGPDARFDHSAIAVGDNQMVIFGGYTETGPADGGVYIYNTVLNSWVTNFTLSAGFDSTTEKSDSGASSRSAVATESAVAKTPCPSPSSWTMVDFVSSCIPSEKSNSSSQSSNPAISSTTIPVNSDDSGAHNHALSVPLVIGLIIGSIGLAGTSLAVCLCWTRRRNRPNKKYDDDASYTSSPRSRQFIRIRRHSPVEEGGPELMDKMKNEKGTNGHKEEENLGAQEGTLSAVRAFGLGVGAVGRGFSSISSRIRGSHWDPRPYSEITDDSLNDAQDTPHPPTSARRMGKGVRLLAPSLKSDKSIYYSPSNTVHVTSVAQDNRIDMFSDEDSMRSEHHLRDPGYFQGLSDTGADVLRSHTGKRYSPNGNNAVEEKEVGAALPVLSHTEGGPNRSSITDAKHCGSNCSHYESLQYRLPNFMPCEPLEFPEVSNAFLIPRYGSLRSNPLSVHIHGSLTPHNLNDKPDCFGQDPHVGTENQPCPTTHPPLHRNSSLFKRMAEASASVLLGRRSSQASWHSPVKQLDIRDPAPQPTLWPVLSQDQLCPLAIATPSSVAHGNKQHPPVCWMDGVSQGPLSNDSHGSNLSSLTSFRSIRDKVVVQKEETTERIEPFGIIEKSDPGGPREPQVAGLNHLEQRESNEIICTSKKDYDERDCFASKQEVSREGCEATVLMDSLAFEPRALDLSLNAIVNPDMEMDSLAILNTAKSLDSESVTEIECGLSNSPSQSSSKNSNLKEATPGTIRTDPFISSHFPSEIKPPQKYVSPVRAGPSPDPCIRSEARAGRRPVREVVNSINKRGGNAPMGFFAPKSFYSAAIGHSPGGTKVYSGPISKSARSSEDAGHSDMCTTFVGSESENISQSMCLPPASEGSLASRDPVVIPKHRETSPGKVRTKTMWEKIKREGTLRVANPSAVRVPESKKPISDLYA
ncbi:hypothetical protein D1P53_005200 [Cryptococcus gattii VGV]|nr:hypothetical protein D1P53_005200 [Cryptococcus gattii VGV]